VGICTVEAITRGETQQRGHQKYLSTVEEVILSWTDQGEVHGLVIHPPCLVCHGTT